MTRRSPAPRRINRQRNAFLDFVKETPGAALVGVCLGLAAPFAVAGIVKLAGIVWGWL